MYKLQKKYKNNMYYFYNINNNRLIKTPQNIYNLLNEKLTSTHKLYNFINDKYKRGTLLDFHLFRIIISSKKINVFSKSFNYILNKYLVLFAFIFSICALPFIKNPLSTFSINQISPLILIVLYAITILVLIPLHEYGHFSQYYNYFNPNAISFGFSVRYLSFWMFFTDVPFINLMPKKEKLNLITAGIKTQIVIWFLITILCLLFKNVLFIYLYYINLGNIISNCIPFFKLDGYWYMSTKLNVDDYMKYFYKMIKKEEKFSMIILILGFINITSIMTIVLFTIYNIFEFGYKFLGGI